MKKQNVSCGRSDDDSLLPGRLILFAAVLLFLMSSCKKQPMADPPDADRQAQVTTTTKSGEKTIKFSKLTWIVRPTSSGSAPGPNNWNSDNVWVDSNGNLHLKLTKNPRTGKWECAEVYTKDKFRYGTYQWQVEGRVDQLDKNVVFGLFNYSGNDYYDEMDIEFARWGSGSNPILNYTVWPKTGTSGNPEIIRWTSPESLSLNGTYSTHRFTRTSSSVKFQSLHGFQNGNSQQIHSVTCTKSFISGLSMPVYMNLYLYKGKAPSNNKEVEIIVHSFSFQ